MLYVGRFCGKIVNVNDPLARHQSTERGVLRKWDGPVNAFVLRLRLAGCYGSQQLGKFRHPSFGYFQT